MENKQGREISKRIRYIVGQLSSIEKMIEKGEEPLSIYVQLRSVESAFNKSVLQTFEKEHRLELAERIVKELENCPGSCKYCELIETLRRDFPQLTLTQVLDGLHQIKKGTKKKGKNRK